ncbi:MAG: efflux RND transporter permease subunit [Vicinamibacteria bacterium]|nr:efflux RND transporter permease subunit [Vicinamibacteria bacterium]
MSFIDWLLSQRRLTLSLVLLLAFSGGGAWFTMVRQEDPRLPDFWGNVVTAYPAADAETVERLVLQPMEDALAEVSEIQETNGTAYDEMAVVFIELRGGLSDYSEVWDRVREALAKARREFPEGALEPQLDKDQQDQDSVVLAVTGSPDPLELLRGARRLKKALLRVPHVARVNYIADPGEQVRIEIDDAAARRLGVTPSHLSAVLAARNRVLPGGSLMVGGKTVRLRPLSEFGSVEEISKTAFVLPSGNACPLGEIATVRLGPAEPAAHRMRWNGETAVGLAVVPRPNINLVDFGVSVRDAVARQAGSLAPMQVQEVTFQPQRVSERLSQLGRSLLLGILIVAGVLFFFMGVRLGLLVIFVIPLVAAVSLAVFSWGGGVLHQISIAALVIALGMLVDNAIVVAEGVHWHIERGVAPHQASVATVRELAAPLAGATATTLAAFVPMLLAEGPTAVFTRSLPIVIMLTLSISYLVAMLVTPILAEMILSPHRTDKGEAAASWGRRLARVATRRPRLVLIAAALLILGSLSASRWVRRQFFPSSDRNQFIVDVRLPEGSHLDRTDAAALEIEKALLARDDVIGVAGFMGRGAPKFYYNVVPVPWSPHYAQLIIETRRSEDVDPLLAWIRAMAEDRLVHAEVVARRLEQGPPVPAPVMVRLFGENLASLSAAARMVEYEIRRIHGAVDVRHDVGPGSPTLRFVIDDASAARFGLTRADVAQTLYGRTRGLSVGELRSEEDPIPVVVRSTEGELLPAEALTALDVAARDGHLVPLGQIARLETSWRPAAIRHRDARRVVTVSSQLEPGFTFSDVLPRLEKRMAKLALPAGVAWSFGGDAEGSGEANAAIVTALPIGMLLLFGVLLLEFNSFRRVGIVLTTVPLAAAGIVPGLLVSRQPFGFMSLLGVIALVGIVVNNAIVMLEVVESRRREGASVESALEDAVARRIRPILLTTTTTVAGLLPLALSPSTLWPPLAWAIISGLTASTLLTLVIVPALYRQLFGGNRDGKLPVVATALALLVGLFAPGVGAEESLRLSLDETLRRGARRPAAQAASENANAARAAATAERRAAFLPVVGGSYSVSERDRELSLVTPIGSFPFGKSRTQTLGAEIVQPLVDPARIVGAGAAAQETRAARLVSERTNRHASAGAGRLHLALLATDARLDATRIYVENLAARQREFRDMVEAGRMLEADALKVELALEQARHDLLALEENRRVTLIALAHAVDSDGRIEALPVPDLTGHEPPDVEASIMRARAARDDLAALEAAGKAIDGRRHAVTAEALPRIDARASWTWTDGAPYDVKSWAEGALQITWSPFAAGTRAARSAALAARKRGNEAEMREARRQVEIEVRSAISSITTAQAAVRVGERGVEQATETLRVERERHLAGRATTNDLLAAEAMLHDQRTRRSLARLAVVQAWIDLWLAGGAELPPFREASGVESR